ncbi:unnamed protein product [Rotaria socialis]|uniref:Ubiquitin-like domain-containing protein n=3 Tax=Rotaria socialis TaxID=392032 RepID=A0A818V3X2_9BILA|nr:unnamed protein product [Rotaria socialis]CAF3417440.1 unnamed protein product [Rotaria socialis]CAF3578404.1 unnamed protein product [Rotaria socialis]CAF3691594.1 unnamed protein product [Rotaria socialis]CAF3709821.1 unnamed protein product [Rotaria socialis]
MSFIEGIGDDFLYALGFFLFIGIVSLAWFSTHVNYIHFPPTLFIIERRTRRNNEDESERTSSVSPSRLTPPTEQFPIPSSENETQAEHDSDNESSENDEFNAEQIPLVPESTSIQTEQSQCIQPDSVETIIDESTAVEENESPSLRIIIKFLNDTKKEILANPNDTISKLKQLHFAGELATNKIIRFIYQGRELQDRETLQICNIRDQTTIHCQITARRHEPTNQRNDDMPSGTHMNRNDFDTSTLIDSSPVNVSSHFLLLLTLMLGFVWYLRIKYRVLFSPISTVVLVLITIIFLIFTCGSFLATRRTLFHRRQPVTTIAITPIQHVHLD